MVDGGYVAFNTESCELEILTTDGKPVWKKWLGDPLMSMPAIADGRLMMAFPDSDGGQEHHLACFELKNGKELWRKPIAGEIITAPVIDDQQVFVATLGRHIVLLPRQGRDAGLGREGEERHFGADASGRAVAGSAGGRKKPPPRPVRP